MNDDDNAQRREECRKEPVDMFSRETIQGNKEQPEIYLVSHVTESREKSSRRE